MSKPYETFIMIADHLSKANQKVLEAEIREVALALYEENEQDCVRVWYKRAYPSDELGDRIMLVSFKDVYELLRRGRDVYPYLAGDSLVRERVFQKLADIYCEPYEAIYNLWVEGAKHGR